MRLADADKLMSMLGLRDAVKYGNKTPEQQRDSYSTIMKYEIRDAIEAAMVDPCTGTDRDFGEIAAYAVRYAIGRTTYAPYTVCGYLTPLLWRMDSVALANIAKEIDEHEQRGKGGLGDPKIDAPLWLELREAIRTEISHREKGNEDG